VALPAVEAIYDQLDMLDVEESVGAREQPRQPERARYQPTGPQYGTGSGVAHHWASKTSRTASLFCLRQGLETTQGPLGQNGSAQ
jgi:hypothetical protein